jgi:lysophospholipase L1-like esterase
MNMKKRFKYFLLFIILTGCQSTDKPFTIFTMGDSTMACKKPEVYPETGWCQVLDSLFDKTVTISNHAVNGRSTKSFIDEGRWQAVLDSLKPGDYIFIQFGHNDRKDYDSTRYTTPFGTYSENMEKFVNETREKGATPVLFTSIVRRKFGADGKLTDTHGDYPVATRQVAEKLNVPLIDLEKITKDWINSLGDEPSKAMYLWTGPNEKFPEGRKDDTHLCENGAKEVARLAMEESKKQWLPFTKHLNKSIK